MWAGPSQGSIHRAMHDSPVYYKPTLIIGIESMIQLWEDGKDSNDHENMDRRR